jgi:adenosylcobinamide-GDP ribazoletransferase
MYRLLASLIFFTRLPFWRIANVPKKYYEQVVPLWSVVGWLTGGIMALVFWLAQMIMPLSLAVIAALISRILITGALHEDGFADFFDGFGGGTTRERTLEIMKDSHIGTYGVLALIIYYLVMYNAILALQTTSHNPFIFVMVDSFCKFLASTIIYFLPYARKSEEAKNKLIYSKVPLYEKLASFAAGILPIILFCPNDLFLPLLAGIAGAAITCALLFLKMKSQINGYTGDCCGATFILAEVVCYLVILAWQTLA